MSDIYGSSPQNIDILSVLVAGTVNLLIAFVLFTLFSLIRPKYKRIYEPKTLFSHPDKRLQKVPRGPFSWARICVDVDETLLVKKIGLDAIVFLQFVLVVGKLLGAMTVLSLVLILVNYFAPTIDKVTHWQAIDFNVSISTISIENIARGSGLFYLYSICSYIYSGYAYYLFYSMWTNYKILKEQYYLLEAGNLNSRILAFTSLTEQYKNSSELELYITEKCHTTPVTMLYDRDCSRLLKILNKHSSSVRKVERILTEYLGNPAIQRPTQKINKKLRICTVDAIDYYKVKIDNLETIIYSSRAMGDEQFEKSSCCFVEFQEIKQAHGILKYFNPSTNLMKLTKLLEPNVKLCPPFIDIIWSNIGLAPAVAKARRMGAVLATIAVTIFWFFVIALAQLLSTIITSSRFENVDGFVKAVLVFLQSFASPAIMAFLNVLIILVLRQITIQQGVVSKTGVERSTLLKFFVFQTYQIITRLGVEVIKAYLENFVTGKASTDQLDKLLKSVISNCVAQSSFFISYVAAGLTYFGVAIMQAVPFLLKWFKSKYFIKTPREFKELDEPVDFPFMEVYGFLLTVFLMAMTYALVAPIIIVFAFVVFTLGYFVFKYQLFYVFENECDSGGLWWPILFDLLCFSILIFQICTFGALVLVGADATIANSKIPNYLVIPLPFVTVVFWIYMTYVVRPKTELVDDKFVVNSAQETCKTLSDRIFNPALVQDLLKIWLAPQHQQKLPEIYQPKYKSIADYIAEANPEQAEKIKEMEDLRLSKRKSCAATSSRAIFFSAQHSVDTFYSCDDLDDESESQI